MKIKKASGWILKNQNQQILILKNRQRQDWGLPKGHIETGESEIEAAYRELAEETGLQPHHIVSNCSQRETLTYFPFSHKGEKYQKTTVYFSADYYGKIPITLSSEHDEFLWAHWPTLLSKITHNCLRKLIFKTNGIF